MRRFLSLLALCGGLLPAADDRLAAFLGGYAGRLGADSGQQAAAQGKQGKETSHGMTSCQDRETRS